MSDGEARAAQEMLDRIREQPIELRRLHHPSCDQGGDALDGGEQDEAYTLGVSGLEYPLGLALLKDEPEKHVKILVRSGEAG